MVSIEEKELKGITGRLVKSTVWQTVILVATVCGIYFQLKGDIRDLYRLREDGQKYWELKFEQIQIQDNILQKQLDEITIRLDQIHEQTKK